MQPSILDRNKKVYILSQFFYALVFTIPIWIFYYRQFISASELSFLVALQAITQLVLELPTGALADLWGRKRTVTLGYFLWFVFGVIIITVPSFIGMLIATIIGGIAESLISGSLEALLFDSCKQEKRESEFSKICATNGFVFQISLALATIIGGIVGKIHPVIPYYLLTLSNLIAAGVGLFFIEPSIDSTKFTLQNYLKQIKIGFQEIGRTKESFDMSIFYILVGGISWSHNLYFFDYMLVELNFPSEIRGIIAGCMRIWNIIIITSLLKNEKIFTRNRSIWFFPTLMIIGFLPGIFFQGYWPIFFIALALMAGTARFVILNKYTNEMYDSKYRATALSSLSMLSSIIYIIIASLSGPVIQVYGVKTMYTILGILSIFTIPLAQRIVQRKKFMSA